MSDDIKLPVEKNKTAKNDVTGDVIKTKNQNEKFEKNYNQIDWSKKK